MSLVENKSISTRKEPSLLIKNWRDSQLKKQKNEEYLYHSFNTNSILLHDDNGKDIATHTYENHHELARIIATTVQKIMQVKKIIFCYERVKGSNFYKIKSTRLVESIVTAIINSPYLMFHGEETKLHPYAKLFIKTVKNSTIELPYSHQEIARGFPSKYVANTICSHLNDWVFWLKSEAKSEAVKSELNSWTRSSRKNKQRVSAYITEAFKKHARILWIRIDVGYMSYHKDTTLLDRTFATFESIKQQIKALLKQDAPHGLFKNRIGYIYKIEYGRDKGYHGHILIALDGKHHCQGISIAKTIGEHWKEITNGHGVYYNCNQRWEKQPYSGIGMVHREDKEKRKHLMRAASYLTKPDDFIRLTTEKGARSFITGRIK